MSTNLLCSFTSILGLKTGEPELEVEAESEMKLEGGPVHGPTANEDELTEAPIVFPPVVLVHIQVFLVAVHLFLGVYVLKEFGSLPPAIDGIIRLGFHGEIL